MYLRIDKSNAGGYTRQFKGQKRICHNSGRTGYEQDMVKIAGKWILKDEVDYDEINDLSIKGGRS